LAEVLPDKYFIIYINAPNLQPHDILLFICHEFGIDISEPSQKFILINKLRDFFISQHSLGRQCVIMIDEAQAMPIETLEEIQGEICESFEHAGGETFTYIPCLNDDEAHIKALVQIINENLGGWLK
jgi:hypothetical protein